MLNAEKVKRLSKTEKKQLDELVKEYEDAAAATRSRRVNGSEREVYDRYHRATKNLSEFLTLHNLQR